MPQIVYAVKIHEVTSGDLKIREVKIGRTKSLDRTISQYKRNIRNPEVLDIWLPNRELGINTCEKGAHELAEQYAYERQSEKFRFLQNSYEQFAENLSLLLEPISRDELRSLKEGGNKKSEDEFEESGQTDGKKLAIGNKVKDVSFNYEYLTKCVEWLIENEYITENDIPIGYSSKKRWLITEDGKHKSGKDFIRPKTLSNEFVIETNFSAEDCKRYAEMLFEEYGPDQIEMKIIN